MELEDKITKTEANYIHSMEYNWKKKQLDVNLVRNPKIPNGADRRITFDNISNFHVEEEIRNSPDRLKKIGKYKDGENLKYVFQTEQRTFMLITDKEPLLTDL